MNLSFELPTQFPLDQYQYGARSDGEIHGVVLTKPHIVDLILDLAGYKTDLDLVGKQLLEPSCGTGAFLMPVIRRLLKVYKSTDRPFSDLFKSIRAFDIDPIHVTATKNAAIATIMEFNYSIQDARTLADHWIHQADFLLAEMNPNFDFVVGNPPYIRIEQLSPEVQTEYRRRYVSLFDRADIYIAFIERSLNLLNKSGKLSFICADRWILNRYGAPMRKIIATKHHVVSYIDLHTASPFDSEVIAYPSIFVIGAGCNSNGVDVFSMKNASPSECRSLSNFTEKTSPLVPGVSFAHYEKWFEGEEPWILSSPEQLAILRTLEEKFSSLESDNETKVGIGVASGGDATYIVPSDLNIEPSRLIPLVMRADLKDGEIIQANRSIINTFADDGTAIDLSQYPLLEKYFIKHESLIRARHVAKKNPKAWFRTIDRVYPELVAKPKLLIPDIAGANEVTYDSGKFHPHHNLYFITSSKWDLEVLGGLLSSKIALFFVWSYATKMRGGYLRFQAQYLRRIRVPNPEEIDKDLAKRIKLAFRKRDFVTLDMLAAEAYNLSSLPDFSFVDTRK